MPNQFQNNLLAQMLSGQGYDARAGFPGFNDPNVNAEFKMSSPAGTPAQPAAQPAAGGNQMSPEALGRVNAIAQLGGAIAGGPETVPGQVGGVASQMAQNVLFQKLQQQRLNQLLQMISGGGGEQAAPFSQVR